MSRRWDNKEVPGRGTKFCLVIDPEDGTQPIKIHGWSEQEVLEKAAHSVETAQATINRLRAQAPARPTAPVAAPVSSEEQMNATADLSNPAKAPAAVKTLLRAGGFDVDRMSFDENVRRVAAIAQEWEAQHPEFPQDARNQRLLLDKATLLAGRFVDITAETLDKAFQELAARDMLFEAAAPANEPHNPPTPPNAPDGNSAPVERPRTATSYRRTALNAPNAPLTTPKPPPKYTRADIDAMNSKVYRDKYDNEPGFAELVNSLSAAV